MENSVNTIASRALIAAVLGAFCLGAGVPATGLAQSYEQSTQSAKPAAKAQTKAAKSKAAPSKLIMAAQQALNGSGANLKVDGRMGKQTREALRKFQTANRIKPTGQLDKATRAKLGV